MCRLGDSSARSNTRKQTYGASERTRVRLPRDQHVKLDAGRPVSLPTMSSRKEEVGNGTYYEEAAPGFWLSDNA